MIRLQNLSFSYGDTPALQTLSLAVEPGERVALIGPSGCGKSTLLRILMGLLTPDRGTLDVLGGSPARDVALRHRIGYVIQEGGLFPHLSARQNVTLAARHIGWSGDRCGDRLEELAALVHLGSDLLDSRPGELSGGQRQRVALMRALFLDPELLLLDEPLGALDPMIRSELQDELREIFDRLQKTVVLVTHDLAEAHFFADRIVLMRGGRIVQTGTLDALQQEPASAFVTEFVHAQRALHLS